MGTEETKDVPPIQLTTQPIIESFRIDMAVEGDTKAELTVHSSAWAGNVKYYVNVYEAEMPLPPPDGWASTWWATEAPSQWGGAGFVLPA